MISLKTHKNPLIYVVEDEPFYQKIIQANLLKHNLGTVKTFYSGEECMKNLSNKPDFIILDYYLGGRNGLDILKDLKKLVPDTHVIFLSAKRDQQVAEQVLENGADSFIMKNRSAFVKIRNRIHRLSCYNKLQAVKKYTAMFVWASLGILATAITLKYFYPNLF